MLASPVIRDFNVRFPTVKCGTVESTVSVCSMVLQPRPVSARTASPVTNAQLLLLVTAVFARTVSLTAVQLEFAALACVPTFTPVLCARHAT